MKNNAFSKLSKNSQLTLQLSAYISQKMFSKQILPVHLFLAVVFNKESLGSRTLYTMGVDMQNILRSIVNDVEYSINDVKKKDIDINLSDDVKKVIRRAYLIANKFSHVYVGTEHLLLSILKDDQTEFIKNLKGKGLDYKSYEESLLNYATYPFGVLASPEGVMPIPQEQTALSVFGRDLVKEAVEGRLDPVIGREEEIKKLVNILNRRKKNNPIIVGEAGVGKTVLVEALAQRIADGNVPQSLKDTRIISLDIASIMAGSKMRGDVEEKMMAIVREVTTSPDVIIFIDEIHNILAGNMPGTSSDIVSVLKPALTQNNFKCIGATTSNEYRQYFEEDNALVRRFQPIFIEQTSVLETIQILKRIKPILESHHGVRIGKDAIEASVKLSDRYVSDRFLPDKAIDLLDEACATMKIEAEEYFGDVSDKLSQLRTVQVEKDFAIKKDKMDEAEQLSDKEEKLKKEIAFWEKKRIATTKSKEYEVDVNTVQKVVSKWTGIPVTTLGGDEKSSLLKLEKSLSKKVIGQKEAIRAVSDAVRRARIGISDEERPWASFLFLGPTGVGKSELAKALTYELFGDEDRLIQVDMSELMEMHSVSKLIGSPPGYVGYREGGQLTEKVRQHPHSVVLFDEIEKAHSDVLNILLQILEYGHLTDGKGRKVNFKNTVIILTSNIGAEEIRKSKILGFVSDRDLNETKTDAQIDQAYDSMKEDLSMTLKESLRPELINRLDDIVIFRSLTRVDAEKIINILLNQLNKRIRQSNIKVEITSDLRDYLIKEGFSDEYGARQLRRILQDNVENVLAKYLLNGGDQDDDISMRNLTLDIKNNNEVFIK